MKSIDWLNVSQERQEIVTLLSSPCQPSTRRKYYAQNIIDEKKQTVLQVDPSRVVMMYMLMTQNDTDPTEETTRAIGYD